MKKERLDKTVVARGLAQSRSQAENFIRLGMITVNSAVITKAGHIVKETDHVARARQEVYVSRAGLKLASVAEEFRLDFQGKTVLDIGSSTGGFTDFALQHGAKKVIAVDVGTDQLHPSLRHNPAIDLHEKTDIRDFFTPELLDIIVGDVSFISLRQIIPHVVRDLMSPHTQFIAMLKPQFEARPQQINKGVVKNSKARREIIRDFEAWMMEYCTIVAKKDSQVAGAKGNVERFYMLTKKPTR